MKHPELEELKTQTEYWKKKLSQIENENIRFKNRLMKILQTEIPRSKLDALDYFHSRFIQLDELITLLKHEVIEQLGVIADNITDTPAGMEHILLTHQRLETKLLILHDKFGHLQREFDMYVRQWF